MKEISNEKTFYEMAETVFRERKEKLETLKKREKEEELKRREEKITRIAKICFGKAKGFYTRHIGDAWSETLNIVIEAK